MIRSECYRIMSRVSGTRDGGPTQQKRRRCYGSRSFFCCLRENDVFSLSINRDSFGSALGASRNDGRWMRLRFQRSKGQISNSGSVLESSST